MMFTVDNVIDMYGVAKNSYEPVPLPQLKAHVVTCVRAGGTDAVGQAVDITAEPIPTHLEWGQVLVSVQAAPINPADLYRQGPMPMRCYLCACLCCSISTKPEHCGSAPFTSSLGPLTC